VVVISGAGPLGLGMVGAARLKSPGTLVVLDMVDARLELARRIGADVALNPREEDVVARVKEMTGGYGCDVYIEAASHPSSVVQGLSMIRKLGRFVEFSVFGEPTTVDWSIIGDRKELDIYGAHLGPYCYPLAIDFLHERRIDLTGVVTHRLPLEEFERGIELVASGRDSIKVILEP
jgi:threonine dehydrogenase-like Zn-dependent dehydrogenase